MEWSVVQKYKKSWIPEWITLQNLGIASNSFKCNITVTQCIWIDITLIRLLMSLYYTFFLLIMSNISNIMERMPWWKSNIIFTNICVFKGSKFLNASNYYKNWLTLPQDLYYQYLSLIWNVGLCNPIHSGIDNYSSYLYIENNNMINIYVAHFCNNADCTWNIQSIFCMLRSTFCEQLMGQTRRILVLRSTSVGRWTRKQESNLQSIRNISSRVEQWSWFSLWMVQVL